MLKLQRTYLIIWIARIKNTHYEKKRRFLILILMTEKRELVTRP